MPSTSAINNNLSF